MRTTFDVLDFHDARRHRRDLTPATLAALEAARGTPGATIRFPPGEHHFWPDAAAERTCYVSNNDYGPRRTIFPLEGVCDLTIDGGRSAFVLHGRLTPFIVDGARNVTIRNLSVDVARPFFSQGRILAGGEDYVDLDVDRTTYPYRVEDGELVLYAPGDEWIVEDDAAMLMTEFDPRTRAPAYDMRTCLAKFRRHSDSFGDPMLDRLCRAVHAEERADGTLRLRCAFDRPFRTGNILAIPHAKRLEMGVFVTGSEAVTVEDLDIYHIGSMGVVAQLSRDIALRRVRAIPKPGTDRLVTINADATHFVHCTGRVTIEDCVFENMLDDAGNIHGIYTIVSRVQGPTTIEVELMHFQQFGLNVYGAGDRITFQHRRRLSTFQTATVKSARLMDPRHITIELAGPIDGVQMGDAVDNPDRMPELIIRNCRTGNNRPRGFLITTSRRTLVEGCVFYNCASGIHVSGDTNDWFESGPVTDLTIRRNTFQDCCYGRASACIAIVPEVKEAPAPDAPRYHANVRIEDNLFRTFDRPVVQARHVSGLRFTGNRYERTSTYPARQLDGPLVRVDDSRDVQIEGA